MLRISVSLLAALAPGFSYASSEITLAWETVTLRIQDRGGVEVTARRNKVGFLEALTVTIRGVTIKIPNSCIPSENSVNLNDLSILYGEFEGGVPYWSLQMEVDYATSHDGVGKYHLVILENDVKIAYIERAESETVLEDDPPLCGSWQ